MSIKRAVRGQVKGDKGGMFFYFLYKLGYFISNVFPLRIAYWLAESFSDIKYFFSKKDKDAVIQNLSIVLKKDKKDCKVIAHKVFRSFATYMVDFFRIPRLDKETIKKKVRCMGSENIDNALKRNKGVIALSCHIGNWEMGGVALAILGYDISAVVLNHKYKKINDFFVNQRERQGFKVVPMSSVMKGCISVLRNKGILALLSDRDFTNLGIAMDFFGVKTSIPKGSVALSLKTGCPIVPIFFLRDGRYSYKFIFDKPIDVSVPPGTREDEALREGLKKVVSVMEQYIRSYPEQWLMFRRFWETPVDAFVI